jgi:WD40 repeat protein
MQEPTIFKAHSSYVLGLLFTHDSRTLVSSGMDNVVKLWSVPDRIQPNSNALQPSPTETPTRTVGWGLLFVLKWSYKRAAQRPARP